MDNINLGKIQIPVIKPQKGVDYYTEAEKKELIEEVTSIVNSNIEPDETQRQNNELERISNENIRKEQENNRENNETTRQNNEETRQNNESSRQSNEQDRIEAEELRSTSFNNQMTENSEAIQNIKDMTETYNQNASSKTSEFNTNAETQLNNFNANATAKIEEYNQNAEPLTARIENLETKSTDLDTRTTTLETENETNKQDIADIKSEQQTQNTNIRTLQQDNTTNKEKLEEVENKNTEQDTSIQENTEDITELQKENAELKAENTLLKSQIPTGQAEGEYITLKDSSNMQMELGVQGNSIQDGIPTAETPNEIQNVTGNSNITVCNKNLIPELFFSNSQKTFTSNGITATIDDDNTVKIKGTATAKTTIYFKNFNLKLKGQRNYQYISNSISGNTRIELHVKVDGSNSYLNSYNETINANAKPTDTLEIVKAYIVVEAGQTVDTTLYFILQEENADTSYIKHEEQVFTFPLAEGQKLYKDSYLADDGVHHKRKQVTFNGTEDVWNTYLISDTKIQFYRNLGDVQHSTAEEIVMSNMFKADVVGNRSAKDNIIYSTTTGFGIATTQYLTKDEFKTFLAEQYANGTPLTVEYLSTEELIEPYTEEQQLVYNEIKKATSYKNVTHIFSTDETSAVFEVTYKKDLETLFNNINSAIVEGGI